VPKLIEYGRAFTDYFSKNYGLNTITGALVPAFVQTVAVGNPTAASAIAQAFDPATVQTLQHGGAAMYTGLAMAALRVALAFAR
jgi:hypothetical protein